MKTKIFNLIKIMLILSFLISGKMLIAQRFVQDSLIISFENFEKPESKVVIETIIDQRGEHPRLLKITEKNKYWFIPVDLLLVTEKPFVEEIKNSIIQAPTVNNKVKYQLTVDQFRMKLISNSKLYSRYQINASVHVYEKTNDGNTKYIGQLLYEIKNKKPRWGNKLKKGYEKVINLWIKDLVNDLNNLAEDKNVKTLSSLENYRKDQYLGRDVNLISSMDLIVAPQGQMWDGEILFSPREAGKKFFRNGYNLRYRDFKSYESIEFGRSIDHLYYRLNDKFLLKGKSQMMIGLNRWKDIAVVKHEIWDAFIFDYSLSQSITFNPIDKSSFVVGMGLMESFYYIDSKGLKFNVGLLINLGVKL